MRSTVLLAILLPLSAHAAGRVSYVLETAASPTSDQTEAYATIRKAMDSAVGYYNKYTSISKSLNVQYNTGVNTADGNSNGTIRFGSNRSYMQVGTAMHEIAHTVGLGTSTEYASLMVGGLWQGAAGIAALKEIDGDAAILKGDAMHFWPYGINYESEVKGVATLVGHCKVVQAMYSDMFKENVFFEGRIRARGTTRCMVRDGNALEMGSCIDTTSLVRIVSMGETDLTYRMEFGDKVLDTPNQASTAGLVMGLYAWSGGTHQRFRIEGTPYAAIRTFHLKMVHSNLYLKANATNVSQDVAASTAEQNSQLWELVDTPTGVEERNPPSLQTRGVERRDALGRIHGTQQGCCSVSF